MHRYIPGAACWWPKAPKPPAIGVASSDAQAAVGVGWYIPAGEGHPRRSRPLRAHDGRRPYHCQLAGGE
ncbi:hypothetical protein D7V94_17640 [Parablautia intestinalis]|uniref:Uncharacterized protein n=1 Tax=Parablautia intestinalis TaxID=2320100 RepID=A0A3A9ADW2_9FIRM|nr:hypothetical protein D7V94_17640 [Parablautia intestinalis]